MGKFDKFTIISADYKKVAGQGIVVDLLIPSKLTAGLRPVIVRFHGGGYVSGTYVQVQAKMSMPCRC